MATTATSMATMLRQLLLATVVGAAYAATPLYQDASAPIYARAADLLAKMTLAEKVAQTYAPYSRFNATAFSDTSIGMLSIGPSTMAHPPTAMTPEQLVAARNVIQAGLMKSSRLKIPASFSQEALHSGTAGGTSRRRDCHFTEALSPSLLKHLLKVEEDAAG